MDPNADRPDSDTLMRRQAVGGAKPLPSPVRPACRHRPTRFAAALPRRRSSAPYPSGRRPTRAREGPTPRRTRSWRRRHAKSPQGTLRQRAIPGSRSATVYLCTVPPPPAGTPPPPPPATDRSACNPYANAPVCTSPRPARGGCSQAPPQRAPRYMVATDTAASDRRRARGTAHQRQRQWHGHRGCGDRPGGPGTGVSAHPAAAGSRTQGGGGGLAKAECARQSRGARGGQRPPKPPAGVSVCGSGLPGTSNVYIPEESSHTVHAGQSDRYGGWRFEQVPLAVASTNHGLGPMRTPPVAGAPLAHARCRVERSPGQTQQPRRAAVAGQETPPPRALRPRRGPRFAPLGRAVPPTPRHPPRTGGRPPPHRRRRRHARRGRGRCGRPCGHDARRHRRDGNDGQGGGAGRPA